MNAELERAAWLANDLLVLVGRFGKVPEGGIEAAALLNGDRFELDVRTRYLEPAGTRSDRVPKRMVIARFPNGAHAGSPPDGIEIGTGKEAFSVDARSVEKSVTDWQTLFAEDLAECDVHHRVAALGAIVRAAAPCLLEPGGFSLALKLAALREELMPHMPVVPVKKDDPQAVAVDEVLAIDDVSFLIRGWMHDADRDAIRFTAVSPEGSRAELLERAFRLSRPDIKAGYSPGLDIEREKHGFVSFFEVETPSLLPGGWVVELVTSSRGIEARGPDVVRDLDTARDQILGLLKHEPVGSHELMENHAHPALSRLMDRLASVVEVDTVVEMGRPPHSPVASIVIPIYRRTDFLEYQIALLAQDPEIHDADVIFVLDSPEFAEPVHREAQELHALYELPFRLAIMNRNAGFANANNAGVSLARGRLLLLLNSDVMPDRPGWLGKLTQFYDSTPDVGALGPKLLYEDDSLQHVGMSFEWEPTLDAWHNVHFLKGLDRHLPAANVTRPVPAVTGACMMIDREIYESLGGLPHMYVQGGYEDSHLCLQLLAEGRRNWYLHAVELYHVEAQSFLLSEDRVRATRYNTWLQSRLWGEFIEAQVESWNSGQAG